MPSPHRLRNTGGSVEENGKDPLIPWVCSRICYIKHGGFVAYLQLAVNFRANILIMGRHSSDSDDDRRKKHRSSKKRDRRSRSRERRRRSRSRDRKRSRSRSSSYEDYRRSRLRKTPKLHSTLITFPCYLCFKTNKKYFILIFLFLSWVPPQIKSKR